MANLGRRPTFGKLQENFEVHLFDFSGDLYGKVLRVALVDFIRPEMKFGGLDQLKAQIAADGEAARTNPGARAGIRLSSSSPVTRGRTSDADARFCVSSQPPPMNVASPQ